MKVFFSGGCKNGKSTLAERAVKALAGEGPLYYIATMIPHDEEDELRIQRHIEQRSGMGFITLEQGLNVLQCLDRAGKIVFVSDYIYSDARHYDAYTEDYRRALAECDRALAEVCDTVVEVCAANPIIYKGEWPL